MGLLTRIRNSFRQQRNYQVLVDANEGYNNASGIIVNDETAMRVSAVYACVRILAESIAQLPVDLFLRNADGSRDIATSNPLYRVIHDTPNHWQTSFEWKEQNAMYVLLRGNAINRIKVDRGVVSLHPIHPSRVRLEVNSREQLVYIVRNKDNREERLLQGEVLHIRGPSHDGLIGETPIQYMANTIGASIASDEHNAATWKNGARPRVVLQTDQALPQNASKETQAIWQSAYGGPSNSGKTAVIDRGLKAYVLPINHSDMEFIEQQKLNATQLAAVFRVPPHMIGLMDSATFSNIEHQQLSFVKMSLMPYLERFEQAIQRDLIDDDRYYAEFNVEGLLRGDTAARATFYREMFNIGVLSVNEIRRFENFNPVDGGDAHFVNLALNTLKNAADGIIPSGDTNINTTTDDTDEPDVEDDTTSADETQAAARSVWNEQVASLIRWECDAITRAAKKPATFLTECESFIYEHQERMAAKLATAERVCRSVGVELSASVFAAEHRAEVWSAILKASEVTAAELPAHVDALCESLRERARNG